MYVYIYMYMYQVEALLQIPLDPDAARDSYGTTALMRAATWGNVDVARLLLEADAEVALPDKGCTVGSLAKYTSREIFNGL